MGKKYRVVTYTGDVLSIEVSESNDKLVVKNLDSGESIELKLEKIDDENYIVDIKGSKYRVKLAEEGLIVDNEASLITSITELISLTALEKRSEEARRISIGKGEVRAPISGKIVEIRVNKGSRVRKGDVIALMSSMKMIVEIKSDYDGVVEEVYAKPNQAVKTGEIIARIKVEEK
ncbi:MAG: DUF2118 domain-containing protein [Thermoprotei archaeon]